MVNTAAIRGGGTHLGVASLHSSVSSVDTQALLEPIVGERLIRIGRVNTIWVASFFLILTFLLGVFAISLALIWPWTDKRECTSYFVAMYVQPVYWSFSLIFDFYFRRKHTESRIEGYLEFYQDIVKHYRAPYYITTMGNALLLALAGVVHQGYGGMEEHCQGNLLDPLHFVCAILFVQAAINVGVIINYMVKVCKFNAQKAIPDALRDEWMASFIRDSYSGGEVGYRERDNYIEDLLEKQADLLRYLKEQNGRLVQKVMILSLQLQERHSSSIT